MNAAEKNNSQEAVVIVAQAEHLPEQTFDF